MEHWTSPPIALTASQAAGSFSRSDLVFYDVDARGASYIARVFLDAPGSSPDLSPDRSDGYAGFFCIFGHGGCFGGPGHCEVPEHRDPFDTAPPHPMTPQVKMVDVTDRLVALDGDSLIVTVLAVSGSTGGAQLIDALEFSSIRLLSYD